MAMLKKILIANRGEIAVRIIRACQELGYDTVAVYSSADRMASHVRMAGEAHNIGSAVATDSYLRSDRIIDAALKSGADGIHPGYGFLAENYEFAQAVIDAGLVWIGPPPEAIRLMGDKMTARKTMQAANVPLVPGTQHGERVTDAELIEAAQEIGYPLLVKATAGGGGKGMRNVLRPEDLPEAIRTARREAQAAFGVAGQVFQLIRVADGGPVAVLALDVAVRRPPHRPDVIAMAFGTRIPALVFHGKCLPFLDVTLAIEVVGKTVAVYAEVVRNEQLPANEYRHEQCNRQPQWVQNMPLHLHLSPVLSELR